MNIRNRIVVALVCAVGLFSVASAFDFDDAASPPADFDDGGMPEMPEAAPPPPPPRQSAASSFRPSGNTISVPGDAKTISAAMISARAGDTVYVAPGTYKERVIMAPGVALVSRSIFGAIINGGGKGAVVTMSKGSTIHGFEIRNGTIGIFSSDMGNEITSNRIVHNWMTGIITVRHLPKIQDNVIAFNRASGIQGWDVRSTAVSVNHNSIDRKSVV
jgi:hypothetical protein